MPRFVVDVSRVVGQTGRLVIDAPNATEAERRVVTGVSDGTLTVPWVPDPMSEPSDVVVTAVHAIASLDSPPRFAQPVIGDVYQPPGAVAEHGAYTFAQFLSNFEFGDTDPLAIIRALLTTGTYDWSAGGTLQRFTCLDPDGLRQQIGDWVTDRPEHDPDRAFWMDCVQGTHRLHTAGDG